MSGAARAWGTGLLSRPGPTLPLALIRIALPLLLWSDLADALTLRRDPAPDHQLIALSFFASTLAMVVGWRSRVASLVAGVATLAAVGVLGHLGGDDTFTHHHTWLTLSATVCLSLTPCGRSLSVDRWLAVRRARRAGAPLPDQRGDLWGLSLLQLQLSGLYLGAVWQKLSLPYLRGERLEQIVHDRFLGSDPVPIPLFDVALGVAAVGSVALEAALMVGLWVPRLRRPLIAAGAAFHLLLYIGLGPGTFSLTVLCLYVAFADQDRLDGWIRAQLAE